MQYKVEHHSTCHKLVIQTRRAPSSTIWSCKQVYVLHAILSTVYHQISFQKLRPNETYTSCHMALGNSFFLIPPVFVPLLALTHL